MARKPTLREWLGVRWIVALGFRIAGWDHKVAFASKKDALVMIDDDLIGEFFKISSEDDLPQDVRDELEEHRRDLAAEAGADESDAPSPPALADVKPRDLLICTQAHESYWGGHNFKEGEIWEVVYRRDDQEWAGLQRKGPDQFAVGCLGCFKRAGEGVESPA